MRDKLEYSHVAFCNMTDTSRVVAVRGEAGPALMARVRGPPAASCSQPGKVARVLKKMPATAVALSPGRADSAFNSFFLIVGSHCVKPVDTINIGR